MADRNKMPPTLSLRYTRCIHLHGDLYIKEAILNHVISMKLLHYHMHLTFMVVFRKQT